MSMERFCLLFFSETFPSPVGLMDDVASIFFRPDQYSPSLLPFSIPAASPSILPPHTLACKKRIWPPAFILNLPCYSNIYFSYLHLKKIQVFFFTFWHKNTPSLCSSTVISPLPHFSACRGSLLLPYSLYASPSTFFFSIRWFSSLLHLIASTERWSLIKHDALNYIRFICSWWLWV